MLRFNRFTYGLLAMVFLVSIPLFSCFATSHFVNVSEDSYLNGRMAPSKKSTVTMRLYRGDEVEVIGFSGDWAEVVGGESGTSYVKAQYLSTILEPIIFKNVSGGRVKVRSQPIAGKTVSWISSGKSITVESIVFGWGRTSSGWIDLSFFEEVK